MSEKSNGGNAFPWCGDLNDCPTINLGMSLRDYFAARLMPHAWSAHQPLNDYDCALAAYRMADAMIRARGAA